MGRSHLSSWPASQILSCLAKQLPLRLEGGSQSPIGTGRKVSGGRFGLPPVVTKVLYLWKPLLSVGDGELHLATVKMKGTVTAEGLLLSVAVAVKVSYGDGFLFLSTECLLDTTQSCLLGVGSRCGCRARLLALSWSQGLSVWFLFVSVLRLRSSPARLLSGLLWARLGGGTKLQAKTVIFQLIPVPAVGWGQVCPNPAGPARPPEP